jgi:hypothetical protein
MACSPFVKDSVSMISLMKIHINKVSRASAILFLAGPASLAPHDAAEILLLARWFELRPKELKRTATPKKWLASGGIRTGALA